MVAAHVPQTLPSDPGGRRPRSAWGQHDAVLTPAPWGASTGCSPSAKNPSTQWVSRVPEWDTEASTLSTLELCCKASSVA